MPCSGNQGQKFMVLKIKALCLLKRKGFVFLTEDMDHK
jgi:hypothetical protein